MTYHFDQIFNLSQSGKLEVHSQNQLRDVLCEISPASSPEHNSSLKKGSNWLSNIQWHPKSPKKNVLSTVEHDSGKKKNKYLSGGFAEQLQKLQRKQHSENIFWQHKDNVKQFLKEKTYMLLKVLEFQCSSGIMVSNCKIFMSANNKDFKLANKTNEVSNPFNNDVKECIVLFDGDQCTKWDISLGCFIKLFTPWIMLISYNLNKPVILCTYFIEVMGKNYSLPSEYSSPKKQIRYLKETSKNEINSKKINFSSRNNLLSVEDHNGCILSAVQMAINWKEICLCVRVHRILTKCINENTFIFDLLCQDADNSFCLIHLRQENKWKPEFFYGKIFWFLNVHISQRLNFSRNPSLLTLFELISNNERKEKHKDPISFCYTFNYSNDDSCVIEEKSKCLPVLVPPHLKTLKTIIKDMFSSKRSTFVAKAVWRWKKIIYITDMSLISYSHLCEENKENNYSDENRKCYIELLVNSDYLPPVLQSENVDCIISVVDCLISKGTFTIDSYTSVFIEYPSFIYRNYYFAINNNTIQSLGDIKIIDVCQKSLKNASIGNLVNINGYIIGIDGKMLSWMECNLCQNSQLTTKNEMIICDICRTTLENPVTKYSMEVFIIDSNNQEAKVKLHDSTIKNMFSHQIASFSDNIQDDIIGAPLSSLICCVISKEHYSSNMKTIFMLKELETTENTVKNKYISV
ncbi:uncharacterized protein [Centruroides vittatus]